MFRTVCFEGRLGWPSLAGCCSIHPTPDLGLAEALPVKKMVSELISNDTKSRHRNHDLRLLVSYRRYIGFLALWLLEAGQRLAPAINRSEG